MERKQEQRTASERCTKWPSDASGATTTTRVVKVPRRVGFTCRTPTEHHSCPMNWCRNACRPWQTPRPLGHGRSGLRTTRSCRPRPGQSESATSRPRRSFLRRTCVQASRQPPKKKKIEKYVRQTPNRTVRQGKPSPRNTSSIKQVSLFVSTTPNATLLVGLVLLGSAQCKSCEH